MKSLALNLIDRAISSEEGKIKDFFKDKDFINKKILFFEIFRAFDGYFELNRRVKFSSECLFGLNELFRLVYDEEIFTGKFPLISSNQELQSTAFHIMVKCGTIGQCRRLIALIKRDLVDVISIQGNHIVIQIKSNIIPEESDNESYVWIRKLVNKNICEPERKKIVQHQQHIETMMSNLVKSWKRYFIQYDTNPDIDKYFMELAHNELLSKPESVEYPDDALFGNIPYHYYRDFMTVICSLAIKHLAFCYQLLKKNKKIKPLDIFTIVRDKNSLIDSMASYFDISSAWSKQILESISINKSNYRHDTNFSKRLTVPLIEVGDNTFIHSIIGSKDLNLNLLNSELKRKYPEDYYDAVNSREEVFKNHLYSFFPEQQYVKNCTSMEIKSRKGNTNIDAAIFDSKNNVLGLFQLKWQDIFGDSLTERDSRMKNLYPSVKTWLDKVEDLITNNCDEELMKKLNFKSNNKPIKIRIFVISRHSVFFYGINPDNRAVYTNMWRLMRALNPTHHPKKNRIEHLYMHLKKFQENSFKKKTKILSQRIQISNLQIDLV